MLRPVLHDAGAGHDDGLEVGRGAAIASHEAGNSLGRCGPETLRAQLYDQTFTLSCALTLAPTALSIRVE